MLVLALALVLLVVCVGGWLGADGCRVGPPRAGGWGVAALVLLAGWDQVAVELFQPTIAAGYTLWGGGWLGGAWRTV